MSTFALLKKGDEYMVVETVDPSGLAAALAFQLDAYVQVSATFPHKALVPDLLGMPMKQWLEGDELEMIKKLAGAINTPPPYHSDCVWDDLEPPVNIWTILEPCAKVDSNTASECKIAVYSKFSKAIARPILKDQTIERTATIAGRYRKALTTKDGQYLRVKQG